MIISSAICELYGSSSYSLSLKSSHHLAQGIEIKVYNKYLLNVLNWELNELMPVKSVCKVLPIWKIIWLFESYTFYRRKRNRVVIWGAHCRDFQVFFYFIYFFSFKFYFILFFIFFLNFILFLNFTFNLYAAYIMQNPRLDELQARINCWET